MHVLIQDGDLIIRLMRDDMADYRSMATWLTDARILEFYEGRDLPLPLGEIEKRYAPDALAAEGVTPCVLVFRGIPIGYLQYYPITEEGKTIYGLDAEEDLTGNYGLDQFIGVPELWNQGIGTRAISLFLRYLFKIAGARRVVLDPHAGNLRAIRCYEKCGFRKVKILSGHELHEGQYRDSWLMEVTPDLFNGLSSQGI